MKGARKLSDMQAEAKEKEGWLGKLYCCVCNKQIEGYYSRHGDGGTCSGKCMKIEDAKPRYPGFSEAEYFQRQGEQNAAVLHE